MVEEDALLTINQVAAILHVDRSTVNELLNEGWLTRIRIGGKKKGPVRIRQSELTMALQRQQKEQSRAKEEA